MNANFIVPPTLTQIAQMAQLARAIGYSISDDKSLEAQWSQIPISESTDHSKDTLEVQQQNTSRIFFSSGGSTGTPKYTLTKFSEVEQNSAIHGKGYAACGIVPTDIVATWGLPGIMSSEFTVYLALAQTGCCILPIGDPNGPDGLFEIIKNFKATVLLVMPSDLTVLTRYMEKNGKKLENIRLIVTGGEPIYQADQARFRRSLGAHVAFRSVFQTSDTGTIGYQCENLDIHQYHIHEDIQILEIHEADGEGVGDLITTNLVRTLRPVVRTRTGDKARKISGTCGCGRKAPVIELRGRTGKFIKVGGEKFDLTWLPLLRMRLNVSIDDFKVYLKRTKDGRDAFVLHSNQIYEVSEKQEQAAQNFAQLSAKLKQQLDGGVLEPLQFKPLGKQDLTKNSSGKLQFFVDLRTSS